MSRPFIAVSAVIRCCWIRSYWREMLDLPADAMPRAVIQGAREKLRLVEVDEKGVVMDIDTRAAYQRALEWGC